MKNFSPRSRVKQPVASFALEASLEADSISCSESPSDRFIRVSTAWCLSVTWRGCGVSAGLRSAATRRQSSQTRAPSPAVRSYFLSAVSSLANPQVGEPKPLVGRTLAERLGHNRFLLQPHLCIRSCLVSAQSAHAFPRGSHTHCQCRSIPMPAKQAVWSIAQRNQTHRWRCGELGV